MAEPRQALTAKPALDPDRGDAKDAKEKKRITLKTLTLL
jgi:hypothetical protein